jgi:hypothetical protein
MKRFAQLPRNFLESRGVVFVRSGFFSGDDCGLEPRLTICMTTSEQKTTPCWAQPTEALMMPFASFASPFVVLLSLAAFAFAEDQKPKLNLTQDGDDLVVSTTITINAGPYVLWTHAGGLGSDVSLYYYVIQNRDRLYRSTKQIEVKWRLAGRKRGADNYRVENIFLPSSTELKELLPQLQKLTDESEHSRPKSKP